MRLERKPAILFSKGWLTIHDQPLLWLAHACGEPGESKQAFFFEKKNQKTFVLIRVAL
jgi:hypothetical protein